MIFSGDNVVLIDASALIFRSYYVNGDRLTRPSDGAAVGAVVGVVQALIRLCEPGVLLGRPFTHIVACLDVPGPTTRHDIDPLYKAHRTTHPSALSAQRPWIINAFEAFGVRTVGLAGYEADDIIATYTRQAVDAGAEVSIMSADKDLMQLVSPQVSLVDHGKRIGPAEVMEKFGVPPALLGDFLALVGDPSDGIQGVTGVGKKTASALLNRYGSLEAVLSEGGEDSSLGKARRHAVARYGHLAIKARQLVSLTEDVPLAISLNECTWNGLDRARAYEWLVGMEFAGLAAGIEKTISGD